MLETHWFILVAGATLSTIAWLFVERRVTTTTGLAAALWSFAALTGGKNLERITMDGTRVATPAPELQYVCTALAALSLLAALLYRFGAYPPQDDDQLVTTQRPNDQPAD